MASRKTLDDYHQLAETRGIKYISERLPQHILLDAKWQCQKGHTWKATYNNIRKGTRCPHCYPHRRQPLGVDDYKKLAVEKGMQFIDKSIPQAVRKKYWWKCPRGHRWQVSYHYIREGSKCPKCPRGMPMKANTISKPKVKRKRTTKSRVAPPVFKPNSRKPWQRQGENDPLKLMAEAYRLKHKGILPDDERARVN